MNVGPRLRGAGLVVVIATAVVGSAISVRATSAPGLSAPTTAAVDMLPLWLGAGAVLDGGDPTDPVAAAARFEAEGLPLRPGGFYSYYPPTASLLAAPLRALPFRDAVTLWRWGAVFATAVGIALGAAAGFRRAGTVGAVPAIVVVSAVVAGLAMARPARIVIATGQPGPWVVLCVGAALFLIGWRRPRAAAAVAAVGAALKLVPLVLLPLWFLRRQRRALAAFGGVLGALLLGLGVLGVPLHPLVWGESLLAFVGRGPLPSWLGEPAWVQALWSVRLPVLAAGTLSAYGITWRRGLDDAGAVDLAAVSVAAVGVMVAGSHHYHEALLVLPAAAHALVWPAQQPRRRVAWVASAALLALFIAHPAAFAARGRPDSLHWLVLGLGAWGVTVVRSVTVGLASGSRSADGSIAPSFKDGNENPRIALLPQTTGVAG